MGTDDKYTFSPSDVALLVHEFGLDDAFEHSPQDVPEAMVAGMKISRECFKALEIENQRLNELLDCPVSDTSTGEDLIENLEQWQKGLQEYAGKLGLGFEAEARMEGITCAIAHAKAYMNPIKL